MSEYVIEMLNITKEFPGIIANDDITLRLRKGEIHALLGENGAGKSTLMSVLFGLYQPEKGEIRKNGEVVKINNPNDANALGIGMVHQHFKLVEIFTVLENIILGVEPNIAGFLKKKEAREKVLALSEQYRLKIDPDALIEKISVGMQQRVEILKMLYRENEVLIFDEPTAVLTPLEIDELMEIMKGFAKEGKSILFITHKLNEIMSVADRCSVLRKGKYIGTVNIKDTTKEELSKMMVGRDVNFVVEKQEQKIGDVVLSVKDVSVPAKIGKKDVVRNVSFDVHAGEIVCLAGIEGNGQTEFVSALTGLDKISGGMITLYIILNKTTFGYELKATGFNKDACHYAGMNGKRNIVITMMIAGALAGLGGAFAILAPTTIVGSSVTYEPINVIAANGFNGIAVALLGNSSPIGIIFSSIFISYIQRGGTLSALYGYKPEIIDIVIAVIIYFSSFSMIMSGTLVKFVSKFMKNQPKVKVEKTVNTEEGMEE